jgi:hypothetical protein
MRFLLNFTALVVIVIVFSMVKLISAAVSQWRKRDHGFIGQHSQRRNGEGPPSRASGEFYVDYRPVFAKIGDSAGAPEDR